MSLQSEMLNVLFSAEATRRAETDPANRVWRSKPACLQLYSLCVFQFFNCR